MTVLTVSNLFPTPDQPQRGMFNAQLFQAMAGLTQIANVCLVPEWRPWRWRIIRDWKDPRGSPFPTAYVPVFYVPGCGRDWSDRTYELSMRRSMQEPMRSHDVILATWLYPDGVAAARLGRESGTPCWIMVQGSDTFHLRSARRRCAILDAARSAAGLICVSRSLADRLVGAGIPANKVHVVPNGVNTELFRYWPQSEARRRIGMHAGPAAANEKWVLFVGNLVPIKGPDVLLDAWAILLRGERNSRWAGDSGDGKRAKSEGREAEGEEQTAEGSRRPEPALRLLLIGEGPMRDALERRVRRLGIAESVRFLGSRPHDEIPLWMNAADGLCLPSRGEGMPNVVLEAMACGLPVIASDVGGCGELKNTAASLYLVAPEDPKALARRLRDIASESVSRREASAETVLSWRQQAERILSLLV